MGTLIATDADADRNAKIEFKIFGGADARFFDIDADAEESGVVRLRSRVEFDFESTTNRYFVELQASRWGFLVVQIR